MGMSSKTIMARGQCSKLMTMREVIPSMVSSRFVKLSQPKKVVNPVKKPYNQCAISNKYYQPVRKIQ